MGREQESKQAAPRPTSEQSASDVHALFASMTAVSLSRAASTWPEQMSLAGGPFVAGAPVVHAAMTRASVPPAAMWSAEGRATTRVFMEPM